MMKEMTMLGATLALFLSLTAFPAFAQNKSDDQKRRSSDRIMSTTATFNRTFTHQTANINGVRLHYVVRGKGEPVVLLHNLSQTWYEWRRIMPVLVERYTVIAADMSGFGDSPNPDSGYDFGIIADNNQVQGRNQSSNAEEIRQLDNERKEATLRSDIAVLDRIYADGFTLTNNRGVVTTKAQILADYNSGNLDYESINIDDVNVQVYGNTAVWTGRATSKGRYKNQGFYGQHRVIGVYVKQQGRWQLVIQQVTQVTEQ